MTLEELAKFLYDNFYDSETNTIIINELDFTKFNCNIDISHMKVEKNLYQREQIVGETLMQYSQKVGFRLFQHNQTVNGNLWQDNQKVGGDLYQHYQIVGGYLVQGGSELNNLYQQHQEVSKNLFK